MLWHGITTHFTRMCLRPSRKILIKLEIFLGNALKASVWIEAAVPFPVPLEFYTMEGVFTAYPP